MALPNDKITTSLVGQTLGTSSRDVGTLCRHQAINKWSKWKPVRRNKVSGIDINDLKAVNFGLQIPTAVSAYALRNAYEAGNMNWAYNRPSGTSVAPYRLGDFRNYEHGALPIVGDYHVSPGGFTETSNTKIMGSMLVATGNNQYNINYDELETDYKYLGIALFNSDGDFVRQSVNPIRGEVLVELDLAQPQKLPDGEYRAMLFLSTNIGLTYAGLDAYPTTLHRVMVSKNIASSVTTELIASYNQFENRVFLRVDIVNNSPNAILTFNNAEARLRYNGKAFNDPMTQGEQSDFQGTLIKDTSTVGGRTIIFVFNNISKGTTSWTVWFNCTGTFARTQQTAILTPHL